MFNVLFFTYILSDNLQVDPNFTNIISKSYEHFICKISKIEDQFPMKKTAKKTILKKMSHRDRS